MKKPNRKNRCYRYNICMTWNIRQVQLFSYFYGKSYGKLISCITFDPHCTPFLLPRQLENYHWEIREHLFLSNSESHRRYCYYYRNYNRQVQGRSLIQLFSLLLDVSLALIFNDFWAVHLLEYCQLWYSLRLVPIIQIGHVKNHHVYKTR